MYKSSPVTKKSKRGYFKWIMVNLNMEPIKPLITA